MLPLLSSKSVPLPNWAQGARRRGDVTKAGEGELLKRTQKNQQETKMKNNY